MSKKPDAGTFVPDLVIRRSERHRYQPKQRDECNAGIVRTTHFDDDGGCYAQGDRGQQLIRNSEERPERVDAAQGIFYALPEEVSPRADDQRAVGEDARVPTCSA